MARPGPQPPVPGLWQADPNTGAVTLFLQGAYENGMYRMVSNHHPLKDGGVYTFVTTVEKLPDPFGGAMVQYRLWQGAQTDGLFLRDEQFPVVGQALWASDNSGVVVDMQKGNMDNVTTAWIPIDGRPVVELGLFVGEIRHWASN